MPRSGFFFNESISKLEVDNERLFAAAVAAVAAPPTPPPAPDCSLFPFWQKII